MSIKHKLHTFFVSVILIIIGFLVVNHSFNIFNVKAQTCSGSTLCCYTCDVDGDGDLDPFACDYNSPTCDTSGGQCNNGGNSVCTLGDISCGGNCGWSPPPGGNPTPTPSGSGCTETGGFPQCAGDCPANKHCASPEGGCNCVDDAVQPTPTPACTYSPGACGWLNECNSFETKNIESVPGTCTPSYNCVNANGACRPPVCTNSSKSSGTLNIGSSITITINGTPPSSPPDLPGATTISQFWLAFYNTGNSTQPIWFQPSVHYILKKTSAECGGGNSCTFTINWSDLNYPDLNWGGQKPVNVQVNGYFVLSDGGFSAVNGSCVQSFAIQQNTNPTCTLTPSGGQTACVGNAQNYSASCSDGQTGISSTTIFYSAQTAVPTWNTICSNASGSCSANKIWNTPGNYWVTVNGVDNTTFSACSGNPWCEWEPVQATQISCGPAGFSNCSVGTDTLLVTVNGLGTAPTLNAVTNACPNVSGNMTPQAVLSWNSSSCASSYEIRRCDSTTSPGCDPSVGVGTVTGTTFTNNIPNPLHTYRYKVRACNTLGQCTAYSNIQNAGPFMTPSSTSTVVASCPFGTGQMSLNWGTGICVETFNLQRCSNVTGACTAADTFNTVFTEANPGIQTNYTDPGPLVQSNYYSYRLESCTNGVCAPPSSITSAQNVCPTCSSLDTFIVPVSPVPMFIGGSTQTFATFTTGPETIASVNYTSGGVGTLSFAPTQPTVAPFQTTSSATGAGLTHVNASVNLLEPGGTVVTNACTVSTPDFPSYLASCTETINGGSTIQVSAGSTVSVPVSVTVTTSPSGGESLTKIKSITCSINNVAVADFCSDITVCPYKSIDPNGSLYFDLTGNSGGSALVTCIAEIKEDSANTNTIAICTKDASMTAFSESWWKAEGGDVVTNSSIRSCIPSTVAAPENILLDASVTSSPYTGVAAGMLNYSDTQTPALCTGNISVNDYNINTIQNNSRDFNYYFDKLPTDFFVGSNIDFKIEAVDLDGDPTTCSKSFDGFCWYLYDGDEFGGQEAVISEDINLGNGKIIVFVKNANLRFDSRINFSDGLGFALVLTDSDMIISPSLGEVASADPSNQTLEGIYIANNFITESLGANISDSQFTLRGILYSQNVALNRDLLTQNSTLPAEYFTYDPGMIFMVPDGLKDKNTFFREVAP